MTKVVRPTRSDRSYLVGCNILMETGRVVETRAFTCRHLFVTAGTLGTNELLSRAKGKGRLSRRLTEHLGQGFGNDGDTFVSRTNLAEKTNPHLGGPGVVTVMNYDSPIAPCLMMRAPLPRFADDFPDKNAISTFVFFLTSHRGAFRYDALSDSVHSCPIRWRNVRRCTWPGRLARRMAETCQLQYHRAPVGRRVHRERL